IETGEDEYRNNHLHIPSHSSSSPRDKNLISNPSPCLKRINRQNHSSNNITIVDSNSATNRVTGLPPLPILKSNLPKLNTSESKSSSSASSSYEQLKLK